MDIFEIKKALIEAGITPIDKLADNWDYIKQMYDIHVKPPERTEAMQIATNILGKDIEKYEPIREKLELIENLCIKAGTQLKDKQLIASIIGLYMKQQ